MAKRSTSGIVCPRCGVPSARVIGRSEALPVLYLRCDDCGRTSVSPENNRLFPARTGQSGTTH